VPEAAYLRSDLQHSSTPTRGRTLDIGARVGGDRPTLLHHLSDDIVELRSELKGDIVELRSQNREFAGHPKPGCRRTRSRY
jgi:hypothetical protein